MTRTLIVPAAGAGTRLGQDTAKVLAPVAGRPMLEHLLARYRPYAEQAILIVAPRWVEAVDAVLQAQWPGGAVVVQERPTGMLDAVRLGAPLIAAARPDRVWVTWCDQLAVRPETLDRLRREEAVRPEPAFVMPTCTGEAPYIHFARDPGGRIVRVLHRREGDDMPARGESDIGVFSLSRETYLDHLARYDADAGRGAGTGERNFLPFIPWLAREETVVTFPCVDAIEALGINTPADRDRIERHLRASADGAPDPR
jgi:bifunctional UDP-N-acetylglucosamine pyrophosphorylase/glucosamine-1-phosphate N-acetyltransferase